MQAPSKTHHFFVWTPLVKQRLLNNAVLTLLYIISGHLGLVLFAVPPANVSPVWFPAGIALAFITARGAWMLPGMILGELALTAFSADVLPYSFVLLWVKVVTITGNCLASLTAARLLQVWIAEVVDFKRVRNATKFSLIVVAAGLFSAIIGVTSLLLGGFLTAEEYGTALVAWWLGDTAGMLTTTPLLILWMQAGSFRALIAQERFKIGERVWFYVLLVMACVCLFAGVFPLAVIRSLPYLLLIFLLWSAFRFPQVETCRASLLITLFALWGVASARSIPFADDSIQHTLLALQIFAGILSATGLLLTSIVQQQRETEQALRAMRDELEARVEERTNDLQRMNDALSRDIAERKKIEEQLQKSEERYRRLTESSPNGIMIHVGGIIHLANPAGLKIMGMDSLDQAIGKSVLEFVPLEQRSLVIDRMKKILSGTPVPKIEEQFIRPDGTLVDVEVVGIPFIYDNQPAAQIVFNDISERKRAEQKLRDSEAKYRLLIANSPDIIMQVNRDFTIDFLHLPGAPQAGVAIDAGMLHVTPESLHSGLQEAVEKVFKTGEPLRYESEEQTIGGEIHVYTTYVSPIINAVNDIVAAYVVSRDITERKRAELSLQHERDLYQALVNSLPGIFYLFDEQGRFLRWNANLERITGYSADEVRRLSPTDFFNERDAAVLPQKVQAVFQEGVLAVEAKLRTKDGRRIPYYFTGSLIKVDGRKCVIGVGLDMTERKRAEAQLRESEARLREAQRVAHIGSYNIDLATNTWTGSEELYAILGIDPATFPMTVKAFMELVHPDYRKRLKELARECIAEGKEFRLDYQIRRPSDGRDVWILGTGRAGYDADGEPVKVYGTTQDITERKEAENAIVRANEILEQRVQERTAELAISMEKERRFNQAKTEFVSLLSHQFRTPLTIILSASELLERIIKKTLNPVPELVEKNLHKISLQIKIMTEMLAGVSRLMNLQTSILREQSAVVNILELCQQTLREFYQRYPSEPPRSTALTFNGRPLENISADELQQLPMTMKVQYIILQTALIELLHNADQYSPRETTVLLNIAFVSESKGDVSALRLQVIDEGKGVRSDERELIFDLFQRGSEERETGDSRGLGIGLTMVKMCVESLGGKIWCEPRGLDTLAPEVHSVYSASESEQNDPNDDVSASYPLSGESSDVNSSTSSGISSSVPSVQGSVFTIELPL
jgi:PAS domain S-box-containing protein